jgi:CheY-like chemotaxis protein
VKINPFNRGQDTETHPRVRILVADDTSSSRELLCAILDGCGYEVAEITDLFRFLERAIAFEPHLVILGLQMPELDGYAAASLLRRQPAFEKVR